MLYFQMRTNNIDGIMVEEMLPCEGWENETVFRLNERLNPTLTADILANPTKYWFDANGVLWQRATVNNLFTDADMEAANMAAWTVNAGGGTGTAAKNVNRYYAGVQSALLTGDTAGVAISQSLGATGNNYTLYAHVYVDGLVPPADNFRFIANGQEVAAEYKSSAKEGWFKAIARNIAWSANTWGFKVAAGATVYVDAVSMNIADIKVDITPPAQPTGVTATGIIRGIAVDFAEPTEDDWATSEVHVSTTSGFTPNANTLAAKGKQTHFEVSKDLISGTTYYVKVIHYDSSGNASTVSNQTSAIARRSRFNDIEEKALLSFADHFFGLYFSDLWYGYTTGTGEARRLSNTHEAYLFAYQNSNDSALLRGQFALSKVEGLYKLRWRMKLFHSSDKDWIAGLYLSPLSGSGTTIPRALISLGTNAGTIRFTSVRGGNGIEPTVTDNISVGDLTVYHIYEIAVSNETCLLYVDGTLKATHSGIDAVPDYPMVPQFELQQSDSTQQRHMYIDYVFYWLE
jgi:hypothetical protein